MNRRTYGRGKACLGATIPLQNYHIWILAIKSATLRSNLNSKMEPQEKYYIQDDEITLKELILKLKEFWAYLWERKISIIAIALLMAIVFGLKAYLKPKEYQASLTFMVDEDTGGSGAIGGILSQFGFGGGGSEYNLQKILTLSKSMRIAKEVFLDTADVDGKKDLLGNHIIDIYKFHEKKSWKKPENGLDGFYFGDASRTQKAKNIALKSVFGKVIGGKKTKNPLYSSSVDDDTGIMTLSVKSKSADLSLSLVKTFFDHLSEYYIEKSTEKAKSTFDILKQKTDSIYTVLGQKEYALARFKDKNRGTYLNKVKVQEQKLMTQIAALRMAWGEALKNQEMANYALKEQTPFIQPIDVPFAPIAPIPNSLLKALVIGGFLGGFLAVGYFVFRKIIRDAMSEDAA